MAATPPTCAYDFIYNASWASNCFATYPCLCSDQNFLATAENSIQQYCDAADQQLWAQYFAENCPGVSIFSTLTTTSNSQSTATAGITSPSADQSTSLSVSSSIFTPSHPTTPTASSPSADHSTSPSVSSSTTTPSYPTTPTASSLNSISSTSTTSEISSTTSSAIVVSPGSTGLSAGDKAGIASAVLTGVAIVIAVLVVMYRRKLEACFRRN